jgi:hypothetical protein
MRATGQLVPSRAIGGLPHGPDGRSVAATVPFYPILSHRIAAHTVSVIAPPTNVARTDWRSRCACASIEWMNVANWRRYSFSELAGSAPGRRLSSKPSVSNASHNSSGAVYR